MFREVLRSTLYSSRRPFSSNATRRSSFSTLIINLLPVLGPPRPKIRLTLSIISGEIGCDHERSVGSFGLRLVPINLFIIYAPAVVVVSAVAWVLAPASGGRQKVFQKSWACGAAAWPRRRGAESSSPCRPHPLPVPPRDRRWCSPCRCCCSRPDSLHQSRQVSELNP